MAYKTLTQLIDIVRQRADIVNDGKHVTDANIIVHINEGIASLYGMIADDQATLFSKNAGTLLNLGDNKWRLPSDFYKLTEVGTKVNSGDRYVQSEELDAQQYGEAVDLKYRGYGVSLYQLAFNIDTGFFELSFFPEPTNDEDIFVRYIPAAPVLSVGTDTLKLPGNWYQWVVLDAAVKCSIREETDPSALMAERSKEEKRIKNDVRHLRPAQVRTLRRSRGNRRRYRSF